MLCLVRKMTKLEPTTVVENLLSAGFGKIEESRIVQSLLAIRGGDFQRDAHYEFDEEEDLADWYYITEQALLRSIEFLSRRVSPMHC